ncbi:MAG: DUF6056 family protein [Oscillospiraceae bacterium]|jgi:hypothetical protein|nr:DUF6056 family protein [Oscillospiraceae bacterium]
MMSKTYGTTVRSRGEPEDKERRAFFLSLAFAAVAAVFTMYAVRDVTLYGDDYYYLSIPFTSARDFFAAHAGNYMRDNGRFIVHVLASLFLRADLCVWRVFLSAEIGAAVFLICRVAGASCAARCAVALAGVTLIGIDVGRESVFWLTGSFNYVYPVVMALLYWHLLKRGEEGRGPRFLIPVAGFLAAASVEQAAIMTVTVTAAESFGHRRAGRGRLSAAVIASVALGAVSVLFAPGQFRRLSVTTGAPGTVPFPALMRGNIRFFILDALFSPHIRVYFVLLAFALSAFVLIRSRRNLRAAALIFTAAALAFAVAALMRGGKYVTPDIIAIMAFFALSSAAVAAMSKNRTAVAAVVAAGVSLAAILPLPSVGLRNTIFSLICATVFMVAVTPEPPFFADLAAALALTAAGAYTAVSIAAGYASNAGIDAENRRRAAEWREGGGGELVQLKLRDERYGHSMPYNSDFHSYYYKLYFGMPGDTEIIWISPPGEAF